MSRKMVIEKNKNKFVALNCKSDVLCLFLKAEPSNTAGSQSLLF
jgi:hypothetical protein